MVFCHRVLRAEPLRRFYLLVFLPFLPLVKILGSGGMKRVFLSYLWRTDAAFRAAEAEHFAAAVVPTVYSELLKELERHRAAGKLTILASASPEFYVEAIGKRLGFDIVLGTPVDFSGVFPDLDNHKGAAKVERLRELLPAEYWHGQNGHGKLRDSHGYSDSTADLPMLALCEHVTVVNPKPALTAIAAKHGWQVLRPARPWKGKLGHAWRCLLLLTGMGKDPAGLEK